jgi:hypothetical protein
MLNEYAYFDEIISYGIQIYKIGSNNNRKIKVLIRGANVSEINGLIWWNPSCWDALELSGIG